VIDDDLAVCTTIAVVLKRNRHDVILADGGQKGLQLFHAGQFDLLIVDIFMPDMDGLETISHVRKAQPTIPIIVISGYHAGTEPAPNFRETGTKLGAVYSLQKPFRPSDLVTAVKSCLSTSLPDTSETMPNTALFKSGFIAICAGLHT